MWSLGRGLRISIATLSQLPDYVALMHAGYLLARGLYRHNQKSSETRMSQMEASRG